MNTGTYTFDLFNSCAIALELQFRFELHKPLLQEPYLMGYLIIKEGSQTREVEFDPKHIEAIASIVASMKPEKKKPIPEGGEVRDPKGFGFKVEAPSYVVPNKSIEDPFDVMPFFNPPKDGGIKKGTIIHCPEGDYTIDEIFAMVKSGEIKTTEIINEDSNDEDEDTSTFVAATTPILPHNSPYESCTYDSRLDNGEEADL